MAEVVCFPLYRRQKLIRELKRTRTTNERVVCVTPHGGRA
jgi:hypothetical protein